MGWGGAYSYFQCLKKYGAEELFSVGPERVRRSQEYVTLRRVLQQ